MSTLLSVLGIFASTAVSETVTASGEATVECVETSTPCNIVCGEQYCREKVLRCHRTSTLPCTIDLNTGDAAYGATEYTHQSSVVRINAMATSSLRSATIFAHEQMGSQLYIYAPGDSALYGSTIYAPVGEHSKHLLYLQFGQLTGQDITIYEDWTTEVYMQSMGNQAFYNGNVFNIFDESTLGISRSDTAYSGLNTAYRAPVTLNNCDKSSDAFGWLTYNGNNHGSWTLYGTGQNAFYQANINAIADIAPYGGVSGYDIKLIAAPMGSTNDDDTAIDTYSMHALTINANQAGANVYAESTNAGGLYGVTIYAKEANSVHAWCHDGGTCWTMTVECPENNQNNACIVYCDNDANSKCLSIELFTTNGLCSDGAILCYGSANVCDLLNSRIYCGYSTSSDYCNYDYSTSIYPCTDSGGSCSNGYNEQTCENEIGGTPISISETFSTSCPSDAVIPTTIDPTPSPSENPTNHPSQSPSQYPSHSPTGPPTISILTKIPSNSPTTKAPTQVPIVSATGNPSSTPTNNPSVSTANNPVSVGPTTANPTDTAPSTAQPTNNPINPTAFPSVTLSTFTSETPTVLPSTLTTPTSLVIPTTTRSPTQNDEGEAAETTTSTDSNDQGEDDNDQKASSSEPVFTLTQLLIVVAMTFVVALCVVVVLCMIYKNTHSLRKQAFTDIELEQMNPSTIASNPNPSTSNVALPAPMTMSRNNHIATVSMTGSSIFPGSVYDPEMLGAGTAGASVQDDMKLRQKQEEIRRWLNSIDSTGAYGQYFSTFVSNGFDSMEFVKAIESADELEEIGIVYPQHVATILAAIELEKEPQRMMRAGSLENDDEVNKYQVHTARGSNDSGPMDLYMNFDFNAPGITVEGEQ